MGMNWSALAESMIKMTVAHNVYHVDRNCYIISYLYFVFLLLPTWRIKPADQ